MLNVKGSHSAVDSSQCCPVIRSQQHSYRCPPLSQHTEIQLLGLLKFRIGGVIKFVKISRRGVSIDPGAKELTVIPCLPTSNASKD